MKLFRFLRNPVEASAPLYGEGTPLWNQDIRRLSVSDGTQYKHFADYLVFTGNQNYTPTHANGQSRAFTLIYSITPTANRTIDMTQGTYHEGASVIVKNLSASYSLIVILSGSITKYVVPGETFIATYLGGGWTRESDAVQPGQITIWPAATAPVGYLLCNGANNLSRTLYSRLFAAIGTTWGAGDGSTTFGIPDQAEASFVGLGSRASGVAAHDTFLLAQFKDDQGQGHKHDLFANITQVVQGSGINVPTGVSSTPSVTTSGSPVSDGSNGSPRFGSVTRGKRLGVNFIIKF